MSDDPLVTVYGTYLDGNGRPLTGSVTFAPDIAAPDDTPGTVVKTQQMVVGRLKNDGRFEVQLTASDDTGWRTGGASIPYLVDERVYGLDRQRLVFILKPGPVDLNTLPDVDVDYEGPVEVPVPGIPGVGVPTGGADQQVLTKKSAADYDTAWETPDAGGVTDHGALTGLTDDDHHQYALADGSRGDFEAAGAVAVHAAAADPHPVYASDADLTAALSSKENTGVAAGLLSTHEAAADPHLQYLTQAEGDALYAGGGVTDHGSLTGLSDDDHPQYLLKTGGTMTGALIVPDPSDDTHAVNRGWALANTAPGPQGPPGGAYLSAQWTFNQTTTPPPVSGGVRLNATTFAAATLLYISETDRDGLDRNGGLDTLAVGDQLMMQSAQGRAVWTATTLVDSGTYRTIGITLVEFTGTRPAASAITTVYIIRAGSAARILSGTATPTAGTGAVGDYYLDTDDRILYGPKASTTYGPAQSTYTNQTPTGFDNSGINSLGADILCNVAGRITGLMFYRHSSTAAGETSRNLYLWNSSGVQIGTASTSGDTGTGWKVAILSTPVVVNAGQTVRVSISQSSQTFSYKASLGPFSNGALSLTQHYATNGTAGRPVDTTSNGYFVDVVYEPDLGTPWPVALKSVPPGGTTAQVLAKTSATDYAAAWATGGGGAPTGAAGGDLSGTYPDPQIAAGVIVNADINASAAIATSKVSGLDTALTARELTANKGAASGYASLDSGTKVPIAQVPTGTSGTTVALGNHTHTAASVGAEAAGSVATHAATAGHELLSSTTPAALGTAAVGTGTTTARADHVHAMPTAAQVGATTQAYVDARTPKITVASSAPGSPTTGDVWMDTT